MEKRVYKYEVPFGTTFGTNVQHSIPINFKILKVDKDPKGVPCVWCEVLTTPGIDIIHQNVTFYTIGTGHMVPCQSTYAGSYFDYSYVWHIYYR